MDATEVLSLDPKLELPEGFHKWHALNVANGATQLQETEHCEGPPTTEQSLAQSTVWGQLQIPDGCLQGAKSSDGTLATAKGGKWRQHRTYVEQK